MLGFVFYVCKVVGILREFFSLFKGCDLYIDYEKYCRYGNIFFGVRCFLLIRFFFFIEKVKFFIKFIRIYFIF